MKLDLFHALWKTQRQGTQMQPGHQLITCVAQSAAQHEELTWR